MIVHEIGKEGGGKEGAMNERRKDREEVDEESTTQGILHNNGRGHTV